MAKLVDTPYDPHAMQAVFDSPLRALIERASEAEQEALRIGIKANSILINQNMVEVPELFSTRFRTPHMICGLNVYLTKHDLPDGYSFAVFHTPNNPEDRLAKFEAIGMEPEELRKAAELYKEIKEILK
jgi:hypothetical protein